MSTGLYSHATRATGTTLTAAIYNGDHVNHITNQTPQMTGAYSDSAGQMQTVTDPGLVGTESLAGSLAGEIERLRFAIKRLTGAAQWYAVPVTGTFATSVVAPTGTFATSVITPIIDSGTTGSLLLKTNNGTIGAEIQNATSGVNFVGIVGGATGVNVAVGAANASTDTNVSFSLYSKGTGSIFFRTNTGNTDQFAVLHTASATRNITVTGSNGGNPTINTTAGSLAITPAIVAASTIVASSTITATAFILSGTVAGTGVVRLANATAINYRNSGDNGDLTLVDSATVNSIADVVRVGPGLLASGVILHGRSGGAAPNTTDLPASMFTVWRDTGGATTKLYYNNGGSIQSVTLS